MDPESSPETIKVDKKSRTLLWVFSLICLVSLVAVTWRFLVLKQYDVIEEPVDITTLTGE